MSGALTDAQKLAVAHQLLQAVARRDKEDGMATQVFLESSMKLIDEVSR